MAFDRSYYVKGRFLTAGGGRAELDPRRAGIRKGVFLISDAPAHCGQFFKARASDHPEPPASSVDDILRRLEKVRAGLRAYAKARGK